MLSSAVQMFILTVVRHPDKGPGLGWRCRSPSRHSTTAFHWSAAGVEVIAVE